MEPICLSLMNFTGWVDLNRIAGMSAATILLHLKVHRTGYDSYVLDEENKGILKANAQILKDKGSIKIQIEGHCDSRGGIQYNIALGEKRANAVKKFLTDQGISEGRISVISFGKEKLIDQSETEAAHAKNRRGTFVITAR